MGDGSRRGAGAHEAERRRDIQGLRAVAVMLVVAFHAGFPLPGGFVGVDVFFVISGFVITAMLAREWQRSGSVRLGAFYLRRVRRLTPALALVVSGTMVLSTLLLSPFGQQQVAARTAVGAMTLCANWVIATATGGYFSPAADDNPLLHTWSLSVEEQFYLAFPLLLLLGWRVGRRFGHPLAAVLTVVGGLGLGSLVLVRGASLGISADSWVLGFYSPFNRAWEFAAGALLALVAGRLRSSRLTATLLGSIGAAALLVSVLLITDETPFPGKWTLLPVAGSVLVLAAGSAHPANRVSGLLSARPMVRLGDWSYSWYLWHWPLIVVATTVFPLSAAAALLAAALSLAPAIASYRWVEGPFRSRVVRPRVLAGAVALVVSTPLVLATASWVVADRVWSPAFRNGAIIAAYPLSPAEVEDSVLPELPGYPCTATELQAFIGSDGLCRQSREGPDVELALLGDSHAEHLFPGVSQAFADRNVAVYSVRAPMMFGAPAHLEAALERLESTPSLRTVVVSRQWSRDGLSPDDELAPLRKTVARLTAAGKTVLVTDDVPSYPFEMFSCRYRIAPVLPWQRCSRDAGDVDRERLAYTHDLASAVAGHPRAAVLPTSRYFCARDTCSMAPQGRVLYLDGNHLNTEGSRYLAARLVTDPRLTAATTR
jgi:peptidoglycan/LPS O-acetylase OafA/YrhL